LECGDSSPLSGAVLLPRRAACRPGKPEYASWPEQQRTVVFPGSKLPDLASSPPPQSGNELPHSRRAAATYL
jgi:hypothetical protein